MGMGPSLAGIVGRQAGTLAGFRYSNAMKKTGATWDAATLNKYLADPQAFAPGNRMPYSGMPEVKDRADLILYLETLK
jgi:cytochrome c